MRFSSVKTSVDMNDIVDARTRSRIMSKISGRDTRPEKIVRAALHRRGFRFSLHRKDLPGRPDIVLPAYDTVVFVNGCFWHYHDCQHFQLPRSNRQFWETKLTSNHKRDKRNIAMLCHLNWHIAIVWECSLRGRTPAFIEKSMDELELWMRRTKFRRRIKVIR